MSGTAAQKICAEVGKEIAKLHSGNIIHGDLTTNNILLHNNVLVFLDFSLGFISSKLEDFAADLLAFKKTFMATHYRHEVAWKALEKAYIGQFPIGRDILEHIKSIERRARYY